ncbi:hypothetical protein CHS0354_020422 [Potamilus streckersoni]|uniref:Transmembrane protein 179 n=1 Tax=Potamilus streckersoni TaxID=2493646 RepID=A0AAE0SV84_9BIVA|nr:hypothetical protein CHS0354_020422 [Potamilus streckersoni]
MGLGNALVLAQVTTFLISFIVSFFLFVPLSTNQHEFNGKCLLYATGNWKSNRSVDDGVTQLENIKWGPDSACGFNIFMGVMVMLVSLFYVVWESLFLCRDTDSSWLGSFIKALLSIVMMLLLFTSSLILSVGFNKWCRLIEHPESQLASCETAQYITFLQDYGIDQTYFYTEIQMAQFGGWCAFVCWVVVMVMALVKVYMSHKQEAFMTSMNRERQRLLQKVGHHSSSTI